MRSSPAKGVPRRASAAAVAPNQATRTTLCVGTMSLLAVSCGISLAFAHVVAQQFPSWRGQIRREPDDADVDVVDVSACRGRRFSVRVPVLNPNTERPLCRTALRTVDALTRGRV